MIKKRYVYNEMIKIVDSTSYSSDVFILKDKKFSVKDGIKFMLFTSHTPCKYLTISFF